MSLDERLEALTHSVELLAQMHQDNERKYDERFHKILDVIEKLAQIAESHERRLNHLDGPQ